MDALLPFVNQWGPVGALTFVVLLIVTGRLVPKSTAERWASDARTERDIWERVAVQAQERLDLKDGVVGAQLEAARVTAKMVRALQTTVEAEDDGDEGS